MTGFRHLADRPVHRGHVWHVVVGRFESPDGTVFERDVVRSPGAVAVVPVVFDAEGSPSVVLVRQYRPALDDHVLEVPAGMRDVPGEPVHLTAARELREEVGLVAARLEPLTCFHPSPGMTDSTTHVLLATGLTPAPRDLQGPEEVHMDLLHLPLAEAVAMVLAGEISDAKTVIGLLLVERRLRDADRGTW